MTIKSNKDQLTWLEKMFPKSGINNSNRGANDLLINQREKFHIYWWECAMAVELKKK